MKERVLARGEKCSIKLPMIIAAIILGVFSIVAGATSGDGEAFFVALIMSAFILLIFWLILFLLTNFELVVTDKRVYYRGVFSIRDIPTNQVGFVWCGPIKSVIIGTAAGAIKCSFVKNNHEIHNVICQLFMQQKGEVTTEEEKPESILPPKEKIFSDNTTTEEREPFKARGWIIAVGIILFVLSMIGTFAK